MPPFATTVCLTSALALCAAPAAWSQGEPPPRPLGSPSASLAEPFSDIAGLRQLSDGRLIVADRLEKAVRLMDSQGTYIDDIGRVGSGPGEFQIPGGLLPLPGDSTLLVDFGNMRLSVIGPDGRIHRSTSMQQPYQAANGGSGMVMVMPRAADGAGGLYFDAMGSFEMGPEGPPDSSAILRWELDGARFDTVAMLPNPAITRSMSLSSSGGARIMSAGGGPLSPKPGWAATPDGRTALVWPDPYRVEWVTRSLERTKGPAVAHRSIPVTKADKEAWADRMAGGAVMVVSGDEGGRSFKLPKPNPDDMEWPEYKPAFESRGIQAAPDGTLWVERFVEAGAPAEYDLFDARGNRIDRVVLPPNRRLVGFGAGAVYLIRIDEDDLQWIERYRR
jgi:hypothetical protein